LELGAGLFSPRQVAAGLLVLGERLGQLALHRFPRRPHLLKVSLRREFRNIQKSPLSEAWNTL
jgi:hypothetical protein